MELLIVTYHYVEDPGKYKAGIYPVSPEAFKSALVRIGKTHRFIHEDELVFALGSGNIIEGKACLVTFDDGFLCQFQNAVPILSELSIPAVFFVPSQQYTEGKASTVHKIHYLLSVADPKDLLAHLESAHKEIVGKEIEWGGVNVGKIISWYVYDDKETAKFKYLLNHLLPPHVADKITSRIFEIYYNAPESDFARSLYFSPENIRDIGQSALFSVGLHSHSHLDISRNDENTVVQDFEKNYEVLHGHFGLSVRGFSYPFGVVGEEEGGKVRSAARRIGLSYGVTTRKGINTNFDVPFLLSRLNPNDLPKHL